MTESLATPPTLAVTVRGHGPRIVLLHGLGGSARYWAPVIEGLGDDVQTWAVDLLGFGRSPKPSASRYDVDSHLAAILPAVHPGSIVVGHSAGAVLAIALANRHPELVDGLVLTGLPIYPDREAASAAISELSSLARWTVEGDRRARWACGLMCRFRPLAMMLAPLLIRGLPASVAVDSTRHTWPAYRHTLRRVVIEHSTAADLVHLRCSVRILQGAGDLVAPPGFLVDLVDERRGAPDAALISLDVVEGDHHLVHRDPALVIEAIRRMLDRSVA